MYKTVIAAVALMLVATQVQAVVHTKVVNYKAGDADAKGFLAWDDSIEGKRPGVLVVHEWWGLNDYAKNRAKQLAKLGYVAFACDMYGEGKVAELPKEAGELAGMLKKNDKEWVARALAGLGVLKKNDNVDPDKLAAIGYCLGGSTAMKLAYAHPKGLRAIASFHGAPVVPAEDQAKHIKAKMLICNGADDTFITEKAIKEFKSALTDAKIDYKFINYPGAVHSFTVPGADKKGVKGIAYNKEADEQSWSEMQKVFKEVFGK
jgi:dienelactone hydrolase